VSLAYPPLPLRPTVCALLESGWSLIVRVPIRVPVALGLKVIEILQVDLEASVLLQVLDDSAKSVAFRPVMVTPLIVTATVSLLVSVTTLGVLVVPTFCVPNASELGETDMEVGAGVLVGVGDGVVVGAGVGVAVGTEVGVGVGTEVGVGEGVGLGDGVRDGEGLGVGEEDGKGLGEAVGLGVGLGLGDGLVVGVGVGVGVLDGVGVGVAVGTGNVSPVSVL
jgi:hypothetical protein